MILVELPSPRRGSMFVFGTKVYNIDGIKEYLNNLAKADAIKEGDVLDIYAIILKTYTVSYVDKEGVSAGAHSVPLGLNDEQVDYTVNMGFVPKSDENFEGWKPIGNISNIVKVRSSETTTTAP